MDFVFLEEILIVIGGLILSWYIFYSAYNVKNNIWKIILLLFGVCYLWLVLYLLLTFSFKVRKIVCDGLEYYGKGNYSIYYEYSCLSWYNKLFYSPILLDENCKYKFEIDKFWVIHKILQKKCY